MFDWTYVRNIKYTNIYLGHQMYISHTRKQGWDKEFGDVWKPSI